MGCKKNSTNRKIAEAACDEYIAIVDVKPYTSDMECFVPLMEKFHKTYGRYPKYPVAYQGMVPTITIFIVKGMGWKNI